MLDVFRYKDRGPTSSKEYNERVRSTAEAYISLLSRVTSAEAEIGALSALTAVEHASAITQNASLAASMESYIDEAASLIDKKVCTVFESRNVLADVSGNPIDHSGVIIDSPLIRESDVGICVLPYESRVSRLGFYIGDRWVIHPEVRANYSFSESNHSANNPERAIDNNSSTAFMVRTPVSGAGACELRYYATLPSRTYSGSSDATSESGTLVNYIDINPSPSGALTLVGIYYSTIPGATLDESDPTQWNELWAPVKETVTSAEKRFRPPIEAQADTYHTNCGPRRYYFGERRMTAVKIVLKPTVGTSFTIEETEEYFIGIRSIDVGHVTFSESGKLVFEYDLPPGVRLVSDVTARIANNSRSNDGLDGVGITQPSMNYYYLSESTWTEYITGTSTIGDMEKLRIEVTMNEASNGCTPILVGFDIEYQRTSE